MAVDVRIPAVEIPPLRDGDRLTREEFEQRWDAMPEVKNAELIEGVVHMAPLSRDHGTPHFNLITWLGMYQMLTPGIEGGDNCSIRFDDRNMPQPDALLRILESHGGRCRVTPDRYLEGGPELLAEVSRTTADDDLGAKREVYRRHKVPEYIVWRVADRELDWFILRGDYYFVIDPGADGILRSEVFPGLWLDAAALIRGDSARVLTVAQLGHGSPEHAAFIAELRRRSLGHQ
ncbi:MAG: Uma2 family endonuclease [Planctomycetaceae bacterium]|nr:Uma2 family endonuclease [Planctomycetaceae bacterium]